MHLLSYMNSKNTTFSTWTHQSNLIMTKNPFMTTELTKLVSYQQLRHNHSHKSLTTYSIGNKNKDFIWHPVDCTARYQAGNVTCYKSTDFLTPDWGSVYTQLPMTMYNEWTHWYSRNCKMMNCSISTLLHGYLHLAASRCTACKLIPCTVHKIQQWQIKVAHFP